VHGVLRKFRSVLLTRKQKQQQASKL